MQFRTELITNFTHSLIDHQQKLLMVGSCFAENIGNKLNQHHFRTKINPLGISYNPLSLFSLLARSLNMQEFQKEELENNGEHFFSFELHSSFNLSDEITFLDKANERIKDQHKWLQKTDHLFISLGTAYVYEKKADQSIVNNCHKIPADTFEKRLLKVDEIVTAWRELQALLEQISNKQLNITFTVSPIRHLKDGFHENQLSKATLLLAIEKIQKEFGHVSYFPAFEIMMDDLRDYRFYEKDLLHPSEEAIEYIWLKFQEAFCNSKTKGLTKRISKFNSAIAHRAFNPKSGAYQDHLKKLQIELIEFQKTNQIDLSKKLKKIKKRLALA